MGFTVGIYVKNSVEAVELYRSVFGLELGYHVLNDDGSYFHSELSKDGVNVCSVVESDKDVSGVNPIELGYTFSDHAELEKAFNALKEGGTVKLDICELPWSPCAACVTDRFGVNWYLTVPGYRPPDDFTPADCK
ncbi:MAG: VOC family protein [Oscillospiraceae bacterium]|nr:VOC family protein [Oscillospiraceae bacterium]